LAGSTALLAVADCDAGNQPFANAAATSAAGHPLAMHLGHKKLFGISSLRFS
jgi:hypothetical protein